MSGQKIQAAFASHGASTAIAGTEVRVRTRRSSVVTRSTAALLATAFLLGACQTRLPNPFSGSPREPVQSGDLPPLPSSGGAQPFDPNAPAPALAQQGQPVGAQPFDPAAAANAAPPRVTTPPAHTQITQAPAATAPQPIQPTASAVQLSRADMLGAWQLASTADTCQLFMTLTTWTGGYRATTKGCNSVELANVTAWDLQNNQVVLVGATGSQVASLSPAGGNRFSGQTKGGAPVSVSR
ncbi:protease inhibitor Inh/omp19 family protein [Pararhizobium sp. IMCC21322]|uniref:protease inhibitor Inh/omp19 family protein n=1 Tax=Pararhizobium sp. IMCC21322 TaxID=3067903 RepID=UPI002742646D|nr:AprI/Inh family metalloprotease inhibitor [Pararhizobium sp. IMCC21322]